MIEYAISSLIGYLLGCFQSSYIIAKKVKKIDIRKHGSNNAGASNATIVLGWKYGIVTALLDISKALLAVIIAQRIFPGNVTAAYFAGAFAIIGHVFPFYLKFKGGKGLASFIGMTLALEFKIALILAVVLVILTILTDYIAIGTLVIVGAFPIYLLFYNFHLVNILVCVGLLCLISYKHIINIKRIYKGEEKGLRTLFNKD